MSCATVVDGGLQLETSPLLLILSNVIQTERRTVPHVLQRTSTLRIKGYGPSKGLVFNLTLMSELDLGAGVIRSVHDVPPSGDAYVYQVSSRSYGARKEKVYGSTYGDDTVVQW